MSQARQPLPGTSSLPYSKFPASVGRERGEGIGQIIKKKKKNQEADPKLLSKEPLARVALFGPLISHIPGRIYACLVQSHPHPDAESYKEIGCFNQRINSETPRRMYSQVVQKNVILSYN